VAFGFAIYLGYVDREGQNTHVVYLVAVQLAHATGARSLQRAGTQRFRQELCPYRLGLDRRHGRVDGGGLPRQGWCGFLARVGRHLIRVGPARAVRRSCRSWPSAGSGRAASNRRAVIVGGGQAAEDLIKVLEASPINEPTSLIIMNKPSCHSETISTKLRY